MADYQVKSFIVIQQLNLKIEESYFGSIQEMQYTAQIKLQAEKVSAQNEAFFIDLSIKLFSMSEEWYMDGTFKEAPKSNLIEN